MADDFMSILWRERRQVVFAHLRKPVRSIAFQVLWSPLTLTKLFEEVAMTQATNITR